MLRPGVLYGVRATTRYGKACIHRSIYTRNDASTAAADQRVTVSDITGLASHVGSWMSVWGWGFSGWSMADPAFGVSGWGLFGVGLLGVERG